MLLDLATMDIYRVYACDPRLIERRMELLIASTGCSTACGRYHQLRTEEVALSVALDERFRNDPDIIRRLEWMAREGFNVFLVEVWCRFEGGRCPYSSCLRRQPDLGLAGIQREARSSVGIY